MKIDDLTLAEMIQRLTECIDMLNEYVLKGGHHVC